MSSPRNKTLDINGAILPDNALTSEFRTTHVNGETIRKVLYPPIPQCPHCRLVDPEYGCVLEKFNGEYSIFCDDTIMFLTPTRYSLSKERRYALYHFMAMKCLYPIARNETRKLPECVVADIQAIFPEEDNSHLYTESDVFFFRSDLMEKVLFMEFRTDPFLFPYPYALQDRQG